MREIGSEVNYTAFCLFVIILHSPPKGGARLSYHKPADHWWSWHISTLFLNTTIPPLQPLPRKLPHGASLTVSRLIPDEASPLRILHVKRVVF